MQKISRTVSVAFALIILVTCRSQESRQEKASDCVILWGAGYSFTIATYEGWTIRSTDQAVGRIAFLYPKEGNSDDATVYGYVTVDAKPNNQAISFKAAIEATCADYLTANPGMQANRDKPFITGDKKTAPVIRFTGHPSGRHEAVAFIEESTIIVRIGYVAKTEQDFLGAYNLLERVVNSYVFLGLKVIDQRHR
jgi:hypothetical protein